MNLTQLSAAVVLSFLRFTQEVLNDVVKKLEKAAEPKGPKTRFLQIGQETYLMLDDKPWKILYYVQDPEPLHCASASSKRATRLGALMRSIVLCFRQDN